MIPLSDRKGINTEMMTVGDLISALKQFPDNLRVVTFGYEGGLDDVEQLDAVKIALNVHTESYYGPHEDVQYTKNASEHAVEQAVLIVSNKAYRY